MSSATAELRGIQDDTADIVSLRRGTVIRSQSRARKNIGNEAVDYLKEAKGNPATATPTIGIPITSKRWDRWTQP